VAVIEPPCAVTISLQMKRPIFHSDPYLSCSAMMDRVHYQVPEQLRQPLIVPLAGQILHERRKSITTSGLAHWTSSIISRRIVPRSPRHSSNVHRLTETAPRKIKDVFHHAIQTVTALRDPTRVTSFVPAVFSVFD
jgi:hypothetical protein